jgi:hypothetical protein
LVMCARRVASGEMRLVTIELETIGASLRQKEITCKQAIEWARQEGLEYWIKMGPEGRR